MQMLCINTITGFHYNVVKHTHTCGCLKVKRLMIVHAYKHIGKMGLINNHPPYIRALILFMRTRGKHSHLHKSVDIENIRNIIKTFFL